MQVAEKHKMTESDVRENQLRTETLKNLRNFRILEKHAVKSKQIEDYNKEVKNLSKLA